MCTLEEPERCSNTHREGSSACLPPPPFVTSQGYLVRARLEGDDVRMRLCMDVAKHDTETHRFRRYDRVSKKMTSSHNAAITDTISGAISGEKIDCFPPGSFIQCTAEVVCWSLDSKRVCVLIARGEVGKVDGVGIGLSPMMLATMAHGDPSTMESVMPVVCPNEWNWDKTEGLKWAIVDGPTLLCLGGNDVAVSFSRLKGGDRSWTIEKANLRCSTSVWLPQRDDGGQQPLNPFRGETHANMLGTDDGEPILVRYYSKSDKIGVGLPGVPHFPWLQLCIKENHPATWHPWHIPAQGATALAYCPFSNGRILYMAVDTRLMIIEDGLLLSIMSLPSAVKTILPLPSERSSATSGLALLLADEARTSLIVPLPLPLSISLLDLYPENADVEDSSFPPPPLRYSQEYWAPYVGVGGIVIGDFDQCGRWKLALLPPPLDAPFKSILKNIAFMSVSMLTCILKHEREGKTDFTHEKSIELPRANKNRYSCGGTKRKRKVEVEKKDGEMSGQNQTIEQLKRLNNVLVNRLLMEEQQLENEKLVHRQREALLKACQGTILKLTEEKGGNKGNNTTIHEDCNILRSDLKCVYRLDNLETTQCNGIKDGGVNAVHREGVQKDELEVEFLHKYFHAASRSLIVTSRVLNQSCSTTMEQICLSLSSEHGTLSSRSTVLSRLPPGESATISSDAEILPGALLSTRNTSKRRDWELRIAVSCHWRMNGCGNTNYHRSVVRMCGHINVSSSELLGLESRQPERSMILHSCQNEVLLRVESKFVDLSRLSQSIEDLLSATTFDRFILWGAVRIENISRRQAHIRFLLRDVVFLEPLLLATRNMFPDGVQLSVDFEALTAPISATFCSSLQDEIALTNGDLGYTESQRFVDQTLLSDRLAIDMFSQTHYFSE